MFAKAVWRLVPLAVVAACGGQAKSSAEVVRPVTASDAGSDASTAPPPEPVEPWPATKPGAAWNVVEWKMNDREASEALARAGFDPKERTDPASGRVEAIDVVSTIPGWKAAIAIDETHHVASIVVRGDPATIAQAHAERAQLEDRFGQPAETHVHWSKQCANDKSIEIEGPLPAWRVTQTLTRTGEEKTAVDWPSLKDLTWGLPLAAIPRAMKSAGFVTEKLPAPPKEKKGAVKRTKGEKKLVELGFKKNDEHVRLGIFEKTGLHTVSVGRDVADRKAAEHRANDALGSLGSCLSEAETETSVFRDATATVRISITGFQGQRVVFETYGIPPPN